MATPRAQVRFANYDTTSEDEDSSVSAPTVESERSVSEEDIPSLASSELAPETPRVPDDPAWIKAVHRARAKREARRRRIEMLSMSAGRLTSVQLMSLFTVATAIFCCALSGHTILVILVAFILLFPRRVVRPAFADFSLLAPAEKQTRRRRCPVKFDESSLIWGNAAPNTFFIMRKWQSLLVIGYCSAYLIAAIALEIAYASVNVQASYAETLEDSQRSLLWVYHQPLSNVSGAPSYALNEYVLFSLWPSKSDAFRFSISFVTTICLLVVAVITHTSLPSDVAFFDDDASKTDILFLEDVAGDARDDVDEYNREASLTLRRQEAVSKKELVTPLSAANRRVRAFRSTLLFASVMMSATLLPSLICAVPVTFMLVFALTAYYKPPDLLSAMVPSVLNKEAARRWRVHFPYLVYHSLDDVGTRVRSVCIGSLHYVSIIVLVTQLIWQNPVFEDWNKMPEASPQRVEISSEDITSEFYHRIGLYNIFTFSRLRREVGTTNVTSFANTTVAQDTTILLATEAMSTAGRLIAQIVFLFLTIVITQNMHASLYIVDVPSYNDHRRLKARCKAHAKRRRALIDEFPRITETCVQPPDVSPEGSPRGGNFRGSVTLGRTVNETDTFDEEEEDEEENDTAVLSISQRLLVGFQGALWRFSHDAYDVAFSFSPLLMPLMFVPLTCVSPSLFTGLLILPFVFAYCMSEGKFLLCRVLFCLQGVYICILLALFSWELQYDDISFARAVFIGGRSLQIGLTPGASSFILGVHALTLASTFTTSLYYSSLAAADDTADPEYERRRMKNRRNFIQVEDDAVQDSNDRDRLIFHAKKLIGDLSAQIATNQSALPRQVPILDFPVMTVSDIKLSIADLERSRRQRWRVQAVIRALDILGAETATQVVVYFQSRFHESPREAAMAVLESLKKSEHDFFKKVSKSGSCPTDLSVDGIVPPKNASPSSPSTSSSSRRDEFVRLREFVVPCFGWALTASELLAVHQFVLFHCPPVAEAPTPSPQAEGSPFVDTPLSLDDLILIAASFKASGAFLTNRLTTVRTVSENSRVVDAVSESAFAPDAISTDIIYWLLRRRQEHRVNVCLKFSKASTKKESRERQKVSILHRIGNVLHEVAFYLLALFQSLRALLQRLLLNTMLAIFFLNIYTTGYRKELGVVQVILVIVLVLTLALQMASFRHQYRAISIYVFISFCALVLTIVGTSISDHLEDTTAFNTRISQTQLLSFLGIRSFESTTWELGIYFLTLLSGLVQMHFLRKRVSVDRTRADLIHVLLDEEAPDSDDEDEIGVRLEDCVARNAWNPPPTAPDEHLITHVRGVEGAKVSVEQRKFVFFNKWRELRGWIEWRQMSSSPFFVRCQMYVGILVALPIFIAIEGFERPNYWVVLFLILFLSLLATSTLSRAYEGRALVNMWVIALVLSCAALISSAAYQAPALRDEVLASLRGASSFVGVRCGKSAASVASAAVDCARELGYKTPPTAAMQAYIHWAVIVVLSGCQIVVLKRYQFLTSRHPVTRRALDQQDKDFKQMCARLKTHVLSPIDNTHVDSKHNTPIAKVITSLIAIFRDNASQVTLLLCIFASLTATTVTHSVYMLLFIFGGVGRAPLVYSSVHFLAIYLYPLGAFPDYWSEAAMGWLGISKLSTSDGFHAKASLLVGPASVFIASILYLNTRELSTAEKAQRLLEDSSYVSTFTEGFASTVTMRGVLAVLSTGRKSSEKRKDDSNTKRIFQCLKRIATFIYDEMVPLFGYEIMLLALLIFMSVNPIRIISVIFFLILSVLVFFGRQRTQEHKYLLYATDIALCVLLAVLKFFQIGIPQPAAGLGEFFPVVTNRSTFTVGRYEYRRYVGADPTDAMVWSVALAVMLMRATRKYTPTDTSRVLWGNRFDSFYDILKVFEDSISSSRAVHGDISFIQGTETTNQQSGCLSSAEQASLRLSLLEELSSTRRRQVQRKLRLEMGGPLAAATMQIEKDLEAVQKFITNSYVALFPPAFFVFIDGSSGGSLLHAIIVGIGIYLFVHRHDIFWRPFRYWPKLVSFYSFVLLTTMVCQIPTIAELIEKSPAAPKALGFAGFNDDVHTDPGEPAIPAMPLTAWRVISIWVCLFQGRVFSSFAFAKYLLAMHRHECQNDARHAATQTRQAIRTQRNTDRLKKREDERRSKLVELRSTRNTEESTVIPVDCDATVTNDKGSEVDVKLEAPVAAVSEDHTVAASAPDDAASPDSTVRQSLAMTTTSSMGLGTFRYTVRQYDSATNTDSSGDEADGSEGVHSIHNESPSGPNREDKSPPEGRARPDEIIVRPLALRGGPLMLHNDHLSRESIHIPRSETPSEVGSKHPSVEDSLESSPESTRVTFSDRLRWLTEKMAEHTYDEGIPKDQRDLNKFALLWKTLFAFLSRFSSTILTILYAINFVVSGSLFDLIPLSCLLCCAMIWYPWAPKRVYTLLLLYTGGGLVVKACVRILVSALEVNIDTARVLSSLFLSSKPNDTVGASPRELARREGDVMAADLFLDYLCLVGVLVHLNLCERWGVYKTQQKSVVDTVALSSDSDESSIDSNASTDTEDERILDELRQRESAFQEREVRRVTRAEMHRERQVLREGLRRARSKDLSTGAIRMAIAFEERQVAELRSQQESSLASMAAHSSTHLVGTIKKKQGLSERVKNAAIAFVNNMSSGEGFGRDIYTAVLGWETLTIIVALGVYYELAGRNVGSFAQSIEENLLPGPLVGMLLFFVLVMVGDRIIYVLSASNVGLAAKIKFFYHIVLTNIYLSMYVYWLHSINVRRSPAGGAVLAAMKIGYCMTSAFQLKYGYPMFRRHDPFTRSLGFTGTLYDIFRAIPFLWDLRMYIDWCFTRTTLGFSDFVKLENIHHEIYNRYSAISDREETNATQGSNFPGKARVTGACTMFTIILFIIFFPLLYFSGFNPRLVDNPIVATSLTVSIEGHGQLYTATKFVDGPTTTSSQRIAIRQLYPSLDLNDYFVDRLFQLVQLETCSASLWGVSPTVLSELLSTNEIHLLFELTLSRKYAVASDLAVKSSFVVELSTSDATAFKSLVSHSVNQPLNGSVPAPLLMKGLYDPFLRNLPSNVQPFSDSSKFPNYLNDCSLNLQTAISNLSGTPQNIRFWCLTCRSLFQGGNTIATAQYNGSDYSCVKDNANCEAFDYENQGSASAQARPMTTDGFFAAIASDQVPLPLSIIPADAGIIALYTTFVFALAGVIRGGLEGSAHRVVLEDCHDPRTLAELVTYIYMSRGGGRREGYDLILEEQLFFELIDLLRSPEALLKRSGLRAKTYDAGGKIIPIEPFLEW